MPVEAKPLFRPDVLAPHVQTFTLPDIDRTILDRWAQEISTGRIDKLGESENLPHFLQDFFIGLLKYSSPAGNKRYTFSVEKHVKAGGQFADAVLGEFNGHNRYVAAIEGKGPLDPLERPFAGRAMSAVDQAYRYAINLRCDWIIVTSMKQTRLYFKGADQQTYERFDTLDLARDENALKRFLFLLGAERVVREDGTCHLNELRTESEKVGKDLTKEFYVNYADMRQDAFERLCTDNPSISRHQVLSSAQKLLDRVLFVAFCEDRTLLPRETIKKAYEHRNPYQPQPIWENFRGLFRAIDAGNPALGIHAYNGGLFSVDPILDSMFVSDEVCGYFRELGEYDYRPPSLTSGEAKVIDVDILGHIFEQSITDLEKLRNELDGLTEPVGAEKHKTRRKKEGAFYTPSFITRYMIEQALSGVLVERFESLRQTEQAKASGSAATALSDPNVYELDKLKKPARTALINFWEAWQDQLATVRLLDPACGSGAFLIEAFDQLHATYERSNDRLAELRGSRSLFDLDKRILENNLYGVDLNDEAIEICRLSLWIKTAEKGKTLASLDHQICVGNSVVESKEVHPRAFNWQEAFPEVFGQGGFDVVVGNPPYIRQEWLSEYKPYWQSRFKTYDGVADIFTYFYERALEVLRPGGRLAFITSGSWVKGNYAYPLRRYLAENASVESMIDFGEYQPFEEAEMIRPSIAVLKKSSPPSKMRLFKWLTSGKPPQNLSDVIADAPIMDTTSLGAESWELDPDDVVALRKKLEASGIGLKKYTDNQIFRGALTGLNEVFVIGQDLRNQLVSADPNSDEIIKPFAQGTHFRPWHTEQSGQYIIFTRRGIEIERYPAVIEYLEQYRKQLTPRPTDWPKGKQWSGRKPGIYKWYELQDAIDYWPVFERPKIVWPDISKLPRFTMDTSGVYIGNTAYSVPMSDYYLLGVLSSWATWFYISKISQPLRLRGNRWQYRLFSQYMERVPVPEASQTDRQVIGSLAKQNVDLATQRYTMQEGVRQRLIKAFGLTSDGVTSGKLNEKAQCWWNQSDRTLGDALKTSFRLRTNPLLNPRTADEWEPYLKEKRSVVDQLTSKINQFEAEINERVFRLFDLTTEETKLLWKEVEH